MERIRGTQLDKIIPRNKSQIKVFSELVNRAMLGYKMGVSYEGARDLYKALGYPTNISFNDYLVKYQRQDIAKAIIDRPVNSTWQGPLELIESNEPEETEFEKAWGELSMVLKLKTIFARVDRLTGLGRYGVLLLGLDDSKDIATFSSPVNEDKDHKLIYIKPFSEQTAKINQFVAEPKDPRYGYPLFYEIQVADKASKGSRNVQVHYSRIIHITDGTLESEVFGTPRLQAVYNRLMDIEKLIGGDAEMFWRGARPGFQGMLAPEYQATDETKKDMKDQLDEYENELRRFFILEGVEMKPLTQQISDPAPHLDSHLKMISAETGIPLRILSGSERGELASSQDRNEWMSYIKSRREEHAEPRILRPTIDRFIELGILPKPEEGYQVDWADLFALSEQARVEIGAKRATAIREYTVNPMAMEVVPPSAFMEVGLGLTTNQIELIKAIRDDEMEDEMKLAAKLQEIMTPPPAQSVVPGQSPRNRDTARKPAAPRPKKKPAV
jgi:hypothetical protein